MSELKNGVMLIENALRCVAQDIELYYKKKAPNGAWCIATCRNAAAQFEQMRSELAELRRAQPLTLEELRERDGQPVWVVAHPDWGHWELSECAEDYLENRDEDFYGMTMPPGIPDPMGRYGLHMMGWLAYAHPPKEDNL